MEKYKSLIFKIMLLVAMIVTITILPMRTANTLFTIKDSKGDDNGGGNIQYPLYLKEYSGLFDLREFKVKEDNEFYTFKVKLSELNNDFDGDNGFSNVLIDIYISTDSNGLTIPYSYGPAVSFDSQNPWKYRLRISPNQGYFEYISDFSTLKIEKIDCEVDVRGKSVLMKVKKSLIDEDLRKAKYYIFSAGYDILGPNEYRQVLKDDSEYEFSGGIVSMYQPNIIDTFNRTQDKMLNFFMPPNYATVYPVYAIGIQKYLLKEYLYIMVFALGVIILNLELKKIKK